MAEKSPLVFVDGGFSQLPPGDSIEGVALGSLVAGSGLVGGGDLDTGSKRLDIGLTASPSGLIFVGDALGLDGVDQATATTALASGNAGLTQAVAALASGVAAQSEAATALASGNAALNAAVNFQGSSSLTFTAASDIRAGYAVGFDGAGRAQSIRISGDPNSRSLGSEVVFEAASTAWPCAVYDSSANRVVIAYQDGGNSSYGTAIVGTVSGTSISFGAAVVFQSSTVTDTSITYNSTGSKVVVSYRDFGNSFFGTAIVGTVSGTSISFGTAVVFESANTTFTSSTYDSTNNRIVIAYRDNGNLGYGTSIVGTVSGSSISFGTAVVFESASTVQISISYTPVSNRVVITYTDIDNSLYGTAIVGTVSGTSISFGTAVVFRSASSSENCVLYDSSNDKFVNFYADGGNSSYGTAIVGTVSGTSISFGTAVVFESANTQEISGAFDSAKAQVIASYRDVGNSGYGTAVVGTISGTSISFGSPFVFNTANVNYTGTAYNSIDDRTVIVYDDGGNSSYGTSIVASFNLSILPTISSLNNFIGVSQSTVASGTDVSVLLPRAIDFNQTGLSPGYFYYVDPTTSGFTTASGQPTAWSGAYNWAPVGKAVSSSGLLLLNPM